MVSTHVLWSFNRFQTWMFRGCFRTTPRRKGLDNTEFHAAIAGAVSGAYHVRAVAEQYGVPVILHTDHCAAGDFRSASSTEHVCWKGTLFVGVILIAGFKKKYCETKEVRFWGSNSDENDLCVQNPRWFLFCLSVWASGKRVFEHWHPIWSGESKRTYFRPFRLR